MTPKKHDIWQGPIIGYGDATRISAGGKFKRPDDVEISQRQIPKKRSPHPRSEYKKPSLPNNAKKTPNRKRTKQGESGPWLELKQAKERLAKVERDKEKRLEASARLRYMQSCLMRLGLTLTTFVGDADDYLESVAAFPFDEGYDVTRQEGRVTVKNVKSKALRLEAYACEGRMSLSLYGGKKYKLHTIEALRSDEYIGATWRVIDLW